MSRTKWVMVVSLCLAGIPAAIYYFGWVQGSTAGFRGDVGEQERQQDADYRIANRDEFFRICGDIDTKNERIESYTAQIKTLEGAQKKQIEAARFEEQRQRDRLVAEYNTKAANTKDQGRWRDPKLPAHIDPEAKEPSCNI